MRQPDPPRGRQRQALRLAVPAARLTPPASGGLAGAADGGLWVQCACALAAGLREAVGKGIPAGWVVPASG
jgi:hypothetical protein